MRVFASCQGDWFWRLNFCISQCRKNVSYIYKKETMKIPKTFCVFLLLLCLAQAQIQDNCFQQISAPSLDDMWLSAEGYTLAAGQTHRNFGEARFYHDGDTIYVYIRNDRNYAGGANIKFDVEDDLADLRSRSNQLNRQKIPISSTTPPGTQLWFASSFACWELPNPEDADCVEDNIYVSIHLDAASETLWVGKVDRNSLSTDTCFGTNQYPGQAPWFCYSTFTQICSPPETPPPPVCVDAFGIPISFVDTERFSFFTPQYWGGNFLLDVDNSLSLDIIADAQENDLLSGFKVGIAIISISADNQLSFTFDLTGYCFVAGELQIDVRTTQRLIRGVPERYTFSRTYPISTETFNGYQVLGVVSDDLEEDIACLLPLCNNGPYWVTVHLHVCPIDC